MLLTGSRLKSEKFLMLLGKGISISRRQHLEKFLSRLDVDASLVVELQQKIRVFLSWYAMSSFKIDFHHIAVSSPLIGSRSSLRAKLFVYLASNES